MKKKFKQKIGTKTSAGEEVVQKRFTNGHKVFTSMEAKRMNEQQSRERVTQAEFEKNFHNLHRPRNPLSGEETPRSGEVYKEKKVLPYPLVEPNRPPPKQLPQPKEVTLKPGQYEGMFAIPQTDDEDHLTRVQPYDKELSKIDSMACLKDKVTAELRFLESKTARRRADINASLVGNYISSQGSNYIVRYKTNV